MKRLKELRAASRYTQEELAKKLNVSQQTVARWEAGKAEPSLASLRDIAVLFGTSVDDLLELEKSNQRKITTNSYYAIEGDHADGFWGHIGLQLPNEEKARWYPITLGAADQVSGSLQTMDKDDRFLIVSTLNNRLLVFAPSLLKRIWLLDDNADQPKDNWELTWDGYQGFSPEIYRGLIDRFYLQEEEYEEAYSESLRKHIDEVIEEEGFNEEEVIERLLETKIHFTDGTSDSYQVEPEHLYNLVYETECSVYPEVIMLHHIGRDYESFYPLNALRLVDMPLLAYEDAQKSEIAALEAEEQALVERKKKS